MDRAILQGNPTTGFRGWLRNLENPKYLQHLLLVPVLIFFIVWNVIPLFWLVGLSFYKYVLVTGAPLKFIGLANFYEIFNSFEIWHALSNTFLFVIIGRRHPDVPRDCSGIHLLGQQRPPLQKGCLDPHFYPHDSCAARHRLFF